jgi:Tol biopolymer transport system component
MLVAVNARKHRLPAMIALVATLMTMPATGAFAAAGDTQVIRGSGGAKLNGESSAPKISATGRYVAFATTATNLDPADADTLSDVYVRDLQTGATTLVSRADGPAGDKGGAASEAPAISADGRYVAFLSKATNLGPAKLDAEVFDVFLRDLLEHRTTLVSRASDGAAADAGSGAPAISADGRVVAFESDATNLDARDADALTDVFARDVRAGTTTLVSGPGTAPRTGTSTEPSVSADGTVVAFTSTVTALHPDDDDPPDTPLADVFTRDLQTGALTLASRGDGSAGEKGNDASDSPAISGDGRVVAFSSTATNLDATDTDSVADVFVRDLALHTTLVVSVGDGQASSNGDADSSSPAISQTGRFVAFTSLTGFDPSDADALPDVYSREVAGARTRLLSRATGVLGAKGNGPSDAPSISADARFTAYTSAATNLDPDDADASTDIFVRDVLGTVAPLDPPSAQRPAPLTLPGLFDVAPTSCPFDATPTLLTAAADIRAGGPGTDILVGGRGADVLRGAGGRDCLYGDEGADRLFGGAGSDRLDGGSGADVLTGGRGDDILTGGAGDDTLSGGGADQLTDARGLDRFSGGAGNDVVRARDSSSRDRRHRDRVSCGAGKRDRAYVDRRDIVARDCERVVRSRATP